MRNKVIEVDFSKKGNSEEERSRRNQESTLQFLTDDSQTESEDINSPSTEELIQQWWDVQSSEYELKKILAESDEIIQISPEELKRYVFHVIMGKIMEEKQLTKEFYSCSDYLAGLITAFITNKIRINKNFLELINEENWADFQRIWDINFLRYVSKYDRKRSSAHSKNDLINQAIWYYDMAYQWHNRIIWSYLAENLRELDYILNFRDFTTSVFQGRV